MKNLDKLRAERLQQIIQQDAKETYKDLTNSQARYISTFGGFDRFRTAINEVGLSPITSRIGEGGRNSFGETELRRGTSNRVKFQQLTENSLPKGAVETLDNGRKIIHALNDPDFTTAVHEIAHVFENELNDADKKTITDWSKQKEWNTNTSEAFAKGFEKYLKEGTAPTPELKTIFEKAKQWIADIYNKLKGNALPKLTPEVRKVYDNLFEEKNINLPDGKEAGNKIPERVPPSIGGEGDGISKQSEVASLIRRGIEAAREKQQGQISRHQQEDIERQVAFDYAKKNNLWIEDLYSLGDPLSGGGNENTLALNTATGEIYKSNNLFNAKNSISKLFDNVNAHNEVFPKNKYEFVGFTGHNEGGTPYVEPIFKQKYVHDAEQASQEEIDTHMGSLGFDKVNDHTFRNADYTVSDLRPRNVLKTADGTIHVIDDIVSKNVQPDLSVNQNDKIKSEDKFGNAPLSDVYLDISNNGINKSNIQKISDHAADIESGRSKYKRFTDEEQTGLKAGGRIHAEASLITGRSNSTGESQDALADRQESDVEAYARKIGVWHDNPEEYLSKKYGEPVNSGNESLIYYDEKSGNVVKTSNIGQYRDLQDALDSITLNNAKYPEAAIKVLGFGLDEEGNFQIIKEQPYIKETGVPATQEEVDSFMQKGGLGKNDELGIDGRYKNDDILANDIKPKNVIKTKDGIVPIDTIMHLNTPEWGGKRITENEIEQNKPTEKTSPYISKPEEQNQEKGNVTLQPKSDLSVKGEGKGAAIGNEPMEPKDSPALTPEAASPKCGGVLSSA